MGVFVFFGRRGWRAYSLDETEPDLPAEHGPWTRFRNVNLPPDADGYEVVRDGGVHVFQSEDSQRNA